LDNGAAGRLENGCGPDFSIGMANIDGVINDLVASLALPELLELLEVLDDECCI
jgi:hypothetical protein